MHGRKEWVLFLGDPLWARKNAKKAQDMAPPCARQRKQVAFSGSRAGLPASESTVSMDSDGTASQSEFRGPKDPCRVGGGEGGVWGWGGVGGVGGGGV